jgi:hypothetical protein
VRIAGYFPVITLLHNTVFNTHQTQNTELSPKRTSQWKSGTYKTGLGCHYSSARRKFGFVGAKVLNFYHAPRRCKTDLKNPFKIRIYL